MTGRDDELRDAISRRLRERIAETTQRRDGRRRHGLATRHRDKLDRQEEKQCPPDE